MRTKRILGIIIIIIGISFIASSFYIKSRVTSGREQISQAEGTVRKGKQLFSLDPIAKEAGKVITDPIDKKLKEESAKADRYDTLATWFQIGGGIFIVIGAGLIFISRKKR